MNVTGASTKLPAERLWAAYATLLTLCLAWALSLKAAERAAPLPTLHTAVEVRNLTPEEADRHYPIHLRGVLTFFDQEIPTRSFRFFQDQTAGIYLYPETAEVARNLSTGLEVEIDGETGKGEYAPVVIARQVRVLGPGVFPAAKPSSYEQLISGQEDSQFVEIEGVARAVRRDALTNYYSIVLATGGGRLTVYARQLPVTPPHELEDRPVKIRGVCMTQFNLRRQLFDVRLVIPRPEDLVVQQSGGREDPFAVPAQSIGSLLQFSPGSARGHRVKVVGTVTYRQNDTAVYVQDQTEGLYAETSQGGRLHPGDKIEVLGFPARGEYTPMLQDAIFRKVGSAREPWPDQVTADEALKGTHDCRLVRLEGTLLDRSSRGHEGLLVLQSSGFIYQAYIGELSSVFNISFPPNGSKVAVTGVCLIEKGSDWFAGGDWRASAFRLLLRTPADVALLKAPPWWTLSKVLWIAGVLGLIAAIASAWVAVLRRRVRRQTEIIRQKLQVEAALKERYQELFENANDIVYTHDLNGRLTSINEAGERLLRHNRQEILGRALVEFMVPEQQAAARHWLEQVRSGTAPDTSEWDFAVAESGPVKLEISTRLVEQPNRPAEVEGIARDISERKRLERELLEISNREQRRIGHDLHDGVCQQLVGIGYLTETLADRLQEKGAAESAEAERISKLINTAIAQTRGVARGLFPVRLEENGLASALEELSVTAAGLFSVGCRVVRAEGPPAMDNAIALHLYYIAQEAIANAAKHGKAKNISLRLEPYQDRYAMTVQDDGRGFVVGGSQATGMGLRIMHYRARVIGAALEVRSQPGEGTTIRCVFSPVFREADKAANAATGSDGQSRNSEVGGVRAL